MEVPTCAGLHAWSAAALVWEWDGIGGWSQAQPAEQPNPVEGSLEFCLLVFDPDTIIAFGNPTNDLGHV